MTSMGLEGHPVTTFAEIPTNVICRIESIGQRVHDLGYYMFLGLRGGGIARVLARYPEQRPRFVEVEVGDQLLSLPINLASEVVVRPCL